jgi:hypothetical protein
MYVAKTLVICSISSIEILMSEMQAKIAIPLYRYYMMRKKEILVQRKAASSNGLRLSSQMIN